MYTYIYTYVYITIALLTSLKRMFSREWRSSKCKNPLGGICQRPTVYSFSFLKKLWQLNNSDTAPVLCLAVPQTAHRRCSWKPANLVLGAPTGYLQATRFGLTSGFGSKTIYIDLCLYDWKALKTCCLHICPFNKPDKLFLAAFLRSHSALLQPPGP